MVLVRSSIEVASIAGTQMGARGNLRLGDRLSTDPIEYCDAPRAAGRSCLFEPQQRARPPSNREHCSCRCGALLHARVDEDSRTGQLVSFFKGCEVLRTCVGQGLERDMEVEECPMVGRN